MSFGIDGTYNRVNESHYPGRIRETNLSEERADDQRHLAELEEFVRKHRKDRGGQKDTVDLHEEENEETPADKEPVGEPPPAEDVPQEADEDAPPHLDVTI